MQWTGTHDRRINNDIVQYDMSGRYRRVPRTIGQSYVLSDTRAQAIDNVIDKEKRHAT